MVKPIYTLALALVWSTAKAQTGNEQKHTPLDRNLHYNVEVQASASKGHTPLWLNANKYGLSSLQSTNGYVRAAVERPLSTDSVHRWGIGYGLDIVGAYHHTAKAIVQQAYVDVRWLKGVLSIGSKEHGMELKDERLSSGAQTLGINARPVPQVRLALPDYWIIPHTGGWLRLKGHLAYGILTDDNWQKNTVKPNGQYSEHTLYHSKAGYLMIGNPDRFYPLSLELGLEMATLFGGTSYNKDKVYHNASGLGSFFRALLPGGADAPETGTVYQNDEGDVLGSWVARINYDADTWRLGIYADKFFEDHSSMLMVDYDGYGTGENWNVREKNKYFLYDFKDIMLGIDLKWKYAKTINTLVFEYLYTKYQSGPIYHDHTPGRPEHISGSDGYYQHYIFNGWQHWGQVMGNPLYRSPIYNTDGVLQTENNRFMAFHIGVGGNPADNIGYRLLATWQEGLGTYDKPFYEKEHNISVMAEMNVQLKNNWAVTAACGMDFGKILGNNKGIQITISKSGILR